MRYEELYDWIHTDTVDFTMPSVDPNASFAGKILTDIGTLDVQKFGGNTDLVQYWSIQDDSPVGYIAITPLTALSSGGKQYSYAKNALSTIQGKGIATALMEFIVKDGYALMSDTVMSTAGAALWNNLKKSKTIYVRIADHNSGETHDLSTIGTLNNKGVIILDPINDIRPEKEQEFFYIAENHIRTIKETKFGVPIKGDRYRFLMPMLGFTEGP